MSPDSSPSITMSGSWVACRTRDSLGCGERGPSARRSSLERAKSSNGNSGGGACWPSIFQSDSALSFEPALVQPSTPNSPPTSLGLREK